MRIHNVNLLDEARAYDLCIDGARNDVKIRQHLQAELTDEVAQLRNQIVELMIDVQVWYYGTARFEIVSAAMRSIQECQEQWAEHEDKINEHMRVLRSHCGPYVFDDNGKSVTSDDFQYGR